MEAGKTRFDAEICIMNQLIKLVRDLDSKTKARIFQWALSRAESEEGEEVKLPSEPDHNTEAKAEESQTQQAV